MVRCGENPEGCGVYGRNLRCCKAARKEFVPLSVVMAVFAHHYSFDATREVMEVSVLAGVSWFQEFNFYSCSFFNR